ncbi:hypothetical protein COLO4_27944 [Corchorus olitorius]|uniref:Uncharacterized protein n=1 Tax=Corchorus olitorius TaxID=93759 RepID=A0A1R3HNH5_9ROSI|nr:hypothetical protein COLO4_27944 [Corchorus olitorius]
MNVVEYCVRVMLWIVMFGSGETCSKIRESKIRRSSSIDQRITRRMRRNHWFRLLSSEFARRKIRFRILRLLVPCSDSLKPYQPGYTAPPRPHAEETATDIGGSWTISGISLYLRVQAERQFLEAGYDEYAASNASGAAFCRSAALIILKEMMTCLLFSLFSCFELLDFSCHATTLWLGPSVYYSGKGKDRKRQHWLQCRLLLFYNLGNVGVLHDAFFKYQAKPKLTIHGYFYHKGKESMVEVGGKIPPGQVNAPPADIGLPDSGVPPQTSERPFLPESNGLPVGGIPPQFNAPAAGMLQHRVQPAQMPLSTQPLDHSALGVPNSAV